ncbi:hypothetical protein G6F57_014965 [Rhizopus arrhizus]|nr:hypothetical protein G6F57_014965 [Rhizopus arrhizus]
MGDKYFDQDAKDALLNDLKQWNSSIESTRFWKERARVKTIVETRSASSNFLNEIIVQETPSSAAFANRGASSAGQSADDEVHNNSQDDINGRGDTDVETPTIPYDHNCSTNAALDMPWLVNNTNIVELFREYQCQARATQQLFQLETDMQEVPSLSDILFLAPNNHSSLKSRIFGLDTLHSLCSHMADHWMNVDTGDNTLSDSEYVAIAKLICAIDAKTISILDAKRDLLTIAASIQGSKANVVEGIANLLTKLPRNRLLDRNKIGGVELQSIYYDALLSEIIADQDRNVALRWANKSDVETDIRPDAIISTLVQHDLGHSIGFGEVKVGNESTTKHSVCLDVVRLGVACKRCD